VLGLAITTLLLASSALAPGPSFDCAKASAPDEIAICGDPELSQLDRLRVLACASGRAGEPHARRLS
jgi:uncharacterized protein